MCILYCAWEAMSSVEREDVGTTEVLGVIADRLNELFATRTNPATGERWTNRSLAQALDGAISNAYLSMLRRAEIANPSVFKLRLLARHFGVSIDWLVGEDEGVPGNLGRDRRLLNALAQGFARDIAIEAGELTREEQQLLLVMMRDARRLFSQMRGEMAGGRTDEEAAERGG
ncbi:MAG TPA: helix-turn-helix transcriptional regulator [Chloroflexota bacterium]|nr:helix-turn-helix transcriptional regulator [Chloroflexota bacterium]